MILGIETSCDETAAALVTEEGEIRASVVSSQAELHARFGGVVPEIASRRHLELVVARCPGGARRGGGEPRRRRHCRGHAGAGPDRRAARRASPRPRRSPGREACRSCPSTISTGTSRRSTSSPIRSSLPFSACSRAAGTRSCSTSATGPATACSAPRSTTLPVRRSTRARACSGSATRAARRSTGSRRTVTPRRSRSRSRSWTGSTSRSRASRRRSSMPCAISATSMEARKADLAASYQRAIVRALVERTRAAAEQEQLDTDRRRRRRRRQQRAARGTPGSSLRAARALHRQRRDDRVGGPVRQTPSLSSVP